MTHGVQLRKTVDVFLAIVILSAGGKVRWGLLAYPIETDWD